MMCAPSNRKALLNVPGASATGGFEHPSEAASRSTQPKRIFTSDLDIKPSPSRERGDCSLDFSFGGAIIQSISEEGLTKMPNRRQLLRSAAGATAGMIVGGRGLTGGGLHASQAGPQ